MNDLINSIISDAEKEDYKRKFELENPNGLGMSVNVGGYGNLIFKDNSAFDQFQQNPQGMTFSQGPGGRRYVEPKAADFDSRFQNLDENFKMRPSSGGAMMQAPALQQGVVGAQQPTFTQSDYMGGIPSMLQGYGRTSQGLLPYFGAR